MYELKKIGERYLRVNLLGPGPRLIKKIGERYLRVNLLGPGPRLIIKIGERYLRVNLLGPGPRRIIKIGERYLRVNLLGPGPRLIKENYWAAVSHSLRNTFLHNFFIITNLIHKFLVHFYKLH